MAGFLFYLFGHFWVALQFMGYFNWKQISLLKTSSIKIHIFTISLRTQICILKMGGAFKSTSIILKSTMLVKKCSCRCESFKISLLGVQDVQNRGWPKIQWAFGTLTFTLGSAVESAKSSKTNLMNRDLIMMPHTRLTHGTTIFLKSGFTLVWKNI